MNIVWYVEPVSGSYNSKNKEKNKRYVGIVLYQKNTLFGEYYWKYKRMCKCAWKPVDPTKIVVHINF